MGQASFDGGGMSILQDNDGTLWLGSWSHGLFCMDIDGSLKQIINPTLTGVGQHIHSLLYIAPHTLLIGCDDGLIRYDILTKRWIRYPESASNSNVSNDDRFVYAIIRDRVSSASRLPRDSVATWWDISVKTAWVTCG